VKILKCLFLTTVFLTLFVSFSTAADPPFTVSLRQDSKNSTAPTMGDRLRFWSTISNTGKKPLEGLVAWISLVEIDPGNEQPVDLEDWSAHKAITGAVLGPGQSLKTDWPMRLIKGGDYRVMVSATERNSRTVLTSPVVEFHVQQKSALQPGRILAVAAGVPLLMIGAIALRKSGRACRKDLLG
jgi:hypothetical protein